MKKSRLRRKSLKPYPALRRKAVAVFHKWIVKRDEGICFTCCAPANQCGHFIHRDCLDFDETNNHSQCSRCNLWLSGNLIPYTIKMLNIYGADKVEELRNKSRIIRKFTREELEDIVNKYSE